MNCKFQKTLFATGLVAASSGLIPGGALAEERASSLEEIIVDARRREESLQDVPMAITAMSGDYLRNNNIENFTDIQYHSPGLRVMMSGTSAQVPIIALRGQRPTEAIITIEPAVHMYFNEVVMSPGDGANIALFDLENVQVLKGPQGTLFGRNSTGGAILFSPTKPGEDYGGYLNLGVGNYDLYTAEFGVDLPASEALKFRFSGKTTERDGYVDNLCGKVEAGSTLCTGGSPELWDDSARSLRLSMIANLTENLENYTVIGYDDSDPVGTKPSLVAFNPTPGGSPLGAFYGIFIDQGLIVDQPGRGDPREAETDIKHYDDVESWTITNTTTWDVGDLTIKNIIGYRDVKHAWSIDADGTGLPFISSPTTVHAETISEEFQVQGMALEDKLEWIAGAYFYTMNAYRGATTLTPSPPNDYFGDGDINNDSSAVFIQATYNFLDDWSATLGARKSWDEREIEVSNILLIDGSCDLTDINNNPVPDDNCSLSNSEKWTANTWQASLTYNLNEKTMFYGSIATGYRAGGFNFRATLESELVPFDEENVTTYELGVKADWELGDTQIRTNLAVYQQDYTDIQVTTAVPVPPPAVGLIAITDNAAEATIEGVDWDITVIPTDGLTLSLNYAHVNATYDDFVDITPTLLPVPQPPDDRSGNRFLWIPQNTVTATVRYTLPLDQSLGDISLQANMYYQSEMIRSERSPIVPDDIEDLVRVQDSYEVYNYQIDWESVMGSQFDVSLWIKNATDEEYVVGGQTVLAQLGSALYNYGEPRTYGLSLNYTF